MQGNISDFSKMRELLQKQGDLKGEDMLDLFDQLVTIIQRDKTFLYDEDTGMVKTSLRDGLIDVDKAYDLFLTMYMTRLKVRTGTSTLRNLKPQELQLAWSQVLSHCTCSSRIEMYDSIPDWDGVPRIDTFMEKYFNCSAHPHFFWLYITGIVAKIQSSKNYLPYFFDFVSPSKGVGKSLLPIKLVGANRVLEISKLPGRLDDLYDSLYRGNKLIFVDDECHCITQKGGGGFNPDQWKSFVTTAQDTFSCKFQKPETHYRGFVITRTSNEVNTVFTTGERRQVVFKINLKHDECRILNLPDSFFQQMLAEAKVYFEKYGIYKLTPEDKKLMATQNEENFNIDTSEYQVIVDFIHNLQDDPDLLRRCKVEPMAMSKRGQKDLISWNSFRKWCENNKRHVIDSRIFWRQVRAMAQIQPDLLAYDDYESQIFSDDRVRLRVFELKPKRKPDDKIEDDDIGF